VFGKGCEGKFAMRLSRTGRAFKRGSSMMGVTQLRAWCSQITHGQPTVFLDPSAQSYDGETVEAEAHRRPIVGIKIFPACRWVTELKDDGSDAT